MKFLGIDIKVKNLPESDKGFIPFGSFIDGYLKDAEKPVTVAIVRPDGTTFSYDTFIHATPDMMEADRYYISRLVKLLLWVRGGATVVVCGDEQIALQVKNEYCTGGLRAFDAEFMSGVFDSDFTVRYAPITEKPVANEKTFSVGNNFDGCRIGFDAGGSDRKVSAVIDGKVVYSEEVVWHPKLNSDPEYHYSGIVESLKTAASKLPRVDFIGVSSAGIYIGNYVAIASLFIKVPTDEFNKKVKDIYVRAAKEISKDAGRDIPLYVLNDGDVTALSGAAELKEGRVLGIAMGTSQAGGYVDSEMKITSWLNELAFVPVDCNSNAMRDEWSGDIGCGVKYFSQDGVIKLATAAGIKLDEDSPLVSELSPAEKLGNVSELSPAEKLKVVQELLETLDQDSIDEITSDGESQGNGETNNEGETDGNGETDGVKALNVFRGIGIYLAHTVNLYSKFYDIKYILLLGRVMSGEGGNVILRTAQKVLEEEYPMLARSIALVVQDESNRRVGQSIAAAGLPK